MVVRRVGELRLPFPPLQVGLPGTVQVFAICLLGKQGQQRGQPECGVPDHRHIHRRTTADVLPAHIQLDHLLAGRQEVAVGEVGADQEQHVASLEGLCGGVVADQPGLTHLVVVVPSSPSLALRVSTIGAASRLASSITSLRASRAPGQRAT